MRENEGGVEEEKVYVLCGSRVDAEKAW